MPLGDKQLAVIVTGKPYPTGTEEAYACFDKFLLEILEAAEITVNSLAQFAVRLAATVR